MKESVLPMTDDVGPVFFPKMNNVLVVPQYIMTFLDVKGEKLEFTHPLVQM